MFQGVRGERGRAAEPRDAAGDAGQDHGSQARAANGSQAHPGTGEQRNGRRVAL